MNSAVKEKAIIYVHVASSTDAEREIAIASQERECRAHAAAQAYDVVAVFADGPGKTSDRPGLTALLTFLREHPSEKYRVVMTDMTRLSRNVTTCIERTAAIVRNGGAIEVTQQAKNAPTPAQFEAFLRWVMTNVKPCLSMKRMN